MTIHENNRLIWKAYWQERRDSNPNPRFWRPVPQADNARNDRTHTTSWTSRGGW
jgi:hypothetical protein